jgi:hypothetical protein
LALELDIARFKQDFSGEFRNGKERRWFRDSKIALKNLKRKLNDAIKYEKLDNDRYYNVITTDFDRIDLPESADRDELVAMREELMRLIDIRDDLNMQLIDLYNGTPADARKTNKRAKKKKVGNNKGRIKATLAARKRAHKGLKRRFRALNKRSVYRGDKIRIFNKMNEIVELRGDIARIKYILRKEKPMGKLRREYVRDIKNAKKDIRILNKSIEHSSIRALRNAKRRRRRSLAMTLGYFGLIALALFVLAMVSMGPELMELIKTIVPAEYHSYVDTFIELWPL